MLFQDPTFLLIFLPVVLACYYMCNSASLQVYTLILASFIFLTFGGWSDVGVFTVLLAFNWLLARKFEPTKAVTCLAIIGNLSAIGFARVFADHALTAGIPLGISFYSFQCIGFHIDRARTPHEFKPSHRSFLCFISFFPQLIAGPILRQRQFLPQLQTTKRLDSELICRGLCLISVGLFKKIMLADPLRKGVDQLYTIAQNSANITTLDAITGSLAYCLQIYFDFSAYSDIAVGLGALFGLRLPHNFLSPYKQRNPSQFWRSWHVTLSQFFRDYLYIPCGGKTLPAFQNALLILAIMALAGLWHGLSFTFLIWGFIHGLALILHRSLKSFIKVPALLAQAFLFLFIVISWVPFRASSFDQMQNVFLGFVSGEWHFSAIGSGHYYLYTALALTFGVLLLPNSQELFGNSLARNADTKTKLAPTNAAMAGIAGSVAILSLSENLQPFLYFRF